MYKNRTIYKDVNDKVIQDKMVMCNILNDFFASADVVYFSTIKSKLSRPTEGEFGIKDILDEDIVKAINSMKVNKSEFCQSLNSSFILQIGEVFIRPLSILFNDSLNTEIIPSKQARKYG